MNYKNLINSLIYIKNYELIILKKIKVKREREYE